MVFAITSFSCVVQEYLISLNAIQKNLLSNKSPYFTITVLLILLPLVCMLLSEMPVFPEHNGSSFRDLHHADQQIATQGALFETFLQVCKLSTM